MKKSIVKSTAAFSALGCVLVVLSAIVEFFLFVEMSKEWGFKYGAIWGIVGWIVLLPILLACLVTFIFAYKNSSKTATSDEIFRYLKTLEILFWATALLLLIIPGLYCVIHDIGHVTIILGQLVCLVMFGLLALVFHLIRGYLPVKS